MIEKNRVYTNLEVVETSTGKYLYYDLHYFIELKDYRLDDIIIVQPVLGVNKPNLTPGLGFDYTINYLPDKITAGKDEEHIIKIKTVKELGHSRVISGKFTIKETKPGDNYDKVNKWDHITLEILHDHPGPNLTHDGSSTAHLGDGD